MYRVGQNFRASVHATLQIILITMLHVVRKQIEIVRVCVQRTVLFLATHMLPATGVMLSMPALYKWMGQPAEVCELMMPCVSFCFCLGTLLQGSAGLLGPQS